MSLQRIKSLRTLIAVWRRQQEHLEQMLSQQRRQLVQRGDEAQAARGALRGCHQQESDHQAARQALLGGGFTPDALILLERHGQTLRDATAQAAKALHKAEQALEKQQALILSLQRDIRRGAQRMDSFHQQMARILSEREAAMEEAAEEETEETSASRFSRRQRAAGENQDGI